MVRLVQGHDLDVVETTQVASDQVGEAAGGGDDDVDALRESADLAVVRRPP
jgi:hypothetical protein